MPRLLLATNNLGKAAELRDLLAGCGWELVASADLGVDIDVEETGDTYHENARIKAVAGMQASGLVTLADDSGLEVQAMGDEPGVHSARFLGPDASFPERFAEIERRLAGLSLEQRACRFVAVIAIADPSCLVRRSSEPGTTLVSGNPDVFFAEGEVRGLIASRPRGDGGFGYDPIFWSPEQSATFGELPEREKAIISHRARAAAGARQILLRLFHEHKRQATSYSRLA